MSTPDLHESQLPLPDNIRALYPWQGHLLEVDGGRLHYLDEGPRGAPPMLCLHGNPTWSFAYRAFVERFAGQFRVVVPDHLGCGLSDKPQHWSYRLADHVANVKQLVKHLGLRNITLVVHDWGGAIGMGVAVDEPAAFSHFVVMNTAAFLSQDMPSSIALVRIPLMGTLAVRGFNAFSWAASHMCVKQTLREDVRAGLLYPYRDWQRRIGTLRFVQDIPLSPRHPSHGTLAAIDRGLAGLADKPMLVLWGDGDFCFHEGFRQEWQRRFPAAEVHAWPDAGHYVFEDVPQRVISCVEAFLGVAEAP